MGSKPKPPAAAPDPAIAEEEARKKSVAIMQADQQRRNTFGSNATFLSRAFSTGANARQKPTDVLAGPDPRNTDAYRANQTAAQLRAEADRQAAVADEPNAMNESGEWYHTGPTNAEAAQQTRARADALVRNISPEDQAELANAQKDAAIADYINKSRSRLGIKSTLGSAATAAAGVKK